MSLIFGFSIDQFVAPASIASDIQSQNSVENVRPPSVVSHSQMNQQFSDCSLQQHQQSTQIHMAIQHHQQQQSQQANAARYQLVSNEMAAINNHQQKQVTHQ